MAYDYRYDLPGDTPCLPYVEEKIPEELPGKDMAAPYVEWNHDSNKLVIWFDVALTIGESSILDGIVSDSLGLVKVLKRRDLILNEIFESVTSQAQANRVFSVLNAYPLGGFALDQLNYDLAREQVQLARQDDIIDDDDMALILSKIPDGKYE